MRGCWPPGAKTAIMNANRFLLDTSAILTLIEDEDGADRVEEVLRRGTALLPWPVLLEAYYISQQERGEAEANRRYALIKQLPVKVMWEIDEATLLTAARLKATQHLSLADAMIAAYAIRTQATLLHKDPEFDALTDLVALEALPYKNQS